MKMEQPASVQLAVSFPEAGQPPAVPQRTEWPPLRHLPSQMHRNPGMLQSPCSPPSNEDDSSNVEEDDRSSSEDADGYDRDHRQYNEDRRRWQENAHHNPPGDGGGDDRRSRPEEVEEELVKEREEDHRRHRPEETESSLVVNIDRRVSLMVMYREPLWLNVSKNRCDRLLRQSQHSKILTRIIRGFEPICALT